MNLGKVLLLSLGVCLAAGCTGGRNINYTPQVDQRLTYLERLCREMAAAAQQEFPKMTGAGGEKLAILKAVSRGAVQEVEESLGGFYDPGSNSYEAIYQGGGLGGERALEDLEKSQLDSLVARVVATGQYQEEIISYYEREMAQVAAPVLVEGRVVSIAWIRSLLPSSLKTVTEEPKFQGTATHKAPGQ